MIVTHDSQDAPGIMSGVTLKPIMGVMMPELKQVELNTLYNSKNDEPIEDVMYPLDVVKTIQHTIKTQPEHFGDENPLEVYLFGDVLNNDLMLRPQTDFDDPDFPKVYSRYVRKLREYQRREAPEAWLVVLTAGPGGGIGLLVPETHDETTAVVDDSDGTLPDSRLPLIAHHMMTDLNHNADEFWAVIEETNQMTVTPESLDDAAAIYIVSTPTPPDDNGLSRENRVIVLSENIAPADLANDYANADVICRLVVKQDDGTWATALSAFNRD